MKNKGFLLVPVLLLAVLCLGGCAMPGAGGGKSDEVHIAIQPSAAFIPLYVAKEKGWIEEALEPMGVKVTWNSFESGPPMNESLLSGDSDIGVIGDVPTVMVAAPDNDVEVIAIAAQAADSYAILVPADSDIQGAADLKGKRVATTFGSTGHNMAQKYLNTAGLTIDDIELVNIAAGDAASVLSKNQAEAVSIWEPNVTRLTADGSVRILVSGSECGLAGTNAIVARSKFAAASPEVITAILGQYKRAADAIPDLDMNTVFAVAKALNVTGEQMDQIIPKFKYTVEITEADMAALNDTIAFLNENQILRVDYDIKESANGSYYKGY